LIGDIGQIIGSIGLFRAT